MKKVCSRFLILLSDADGAMLEPLGIAIHSVDLGKIKAGMTAGVFGCGPIGLLIIQMAKLSGAANIIAADKLSASSGGRKKFWCKRSLFSGRQVTAWRDPGGDNERGVDVAFEAAGSRMLSMRRLLRSHPVEKLSSQESRMTTKLRSLLRLRGEKVSR